MTVNYRGVPVSLHSVEMTRFMTFQRRLIGCGGKSRPCPWRMCRDTLENLRKMELITFGQKCFEIHAEFFIVCNFCVIFEDSVCMVFKKCLQQHKLIF